MDTKKGNLKKENEKKVLNTADVNSSLWLVKIPNHIAEKWAEKETNDILGNLSVTMISESNMGPPSKKIKIKLAPDPDVPYVAGMNDFILEELSTGPQLFSFNYNDTSQAFSIAGKVTKKCTLMPENFNSYGKMRQEVEKKDSIKRRTVQSLDNRNVSINLNGSHEIPFIPPVYADKKIGKDYTIDQDELRQNLFFAMGREEKMTLKELLQVCSCNEADLKTLLSSYCVYNKKGLNKYYYELKPEYKDMSIK